MNEQCSDKARAYFLDGYKKYYGSYMLQDFNKGRHYLIEGKVKIWFVFKKEHFKTFSYKFPELIAKYPEYAGEGDSINTKMLTLAVNYGCKYIVFAHKEDAYYYADPLELLTFCADNDLKRVQDRSNSYRGLGGTRDNVHEYTYSFPLKLLKEWKFNERLE